MSKSHKPDEYLLATRVDEYDAWAFAGLFFDMKSAERSRRALVRARESFRGEVALVLVEECFASVQRAWGADKVSASSIRRELRERLTERIGEDAAREWANRRRSYWFAESERIAETWNVYRPEESENEIDIEVASVVDKHRRAAS